MNFQLKEMGFGKKNLNVVVAFMDAYEAEKPIFTYHSDGSANNPHRILMRMPIIRKRSTEEAYTYY